MRAVSYRGENKYEEYLQIANIISSKISTMDGVVGILGTGGLGRRYCDRFSDLDLIVYAHEGHRDRISEMLSVGVRHREVDLDVEVRNFEQACKNEVPSEYWNQVSRWDLQNSQILNDSEGRLRTLLREKLIFPEKERNELMENHRNLVEEQLQFNFLVWKERGSLYNVAQVLRSAVEHLLLWIYAKNWEFQPYLPKWLFYHLEGDLIPESRYLPPIAEVYTLPISNLDEADYLRKSLMDVCEKVGLKWRFHDLEDAFERSRKRWEESSEITRYYLSW